MINEEYIKKIINELFPNSKIYPCKELNISKQFYKLGDELYINAKFFVKQMYLKNDTKWGEKLYEKLFQHFPENQDILDSISIKDCICVDVDSPLDIVIVKITNYKTDKDTQKNFSVRIFKKKISTSTIKNMGSSSEIFIENTQVEILKNGEVVAYGVLQNKDGKVIIKITEVLK